MNNNGILHEDTKTRRVENIRHTRAGGYPDSQQPIVQQAVGQLASQFQAGQFFTQFVQGALALLPIFHGGGTS
jgi:hypothetical protein